VCGHQLSSVSTTRGTSVDAPAGSIRAASAEESEEPGECSGDTLPSTGSTTSVLGGGTTGAVMRYEYRSSLELSEDATASTVVAPPALVSMLVVGVEAGIANRGTE
jgi:hypothetical protein